MQKHSKKMKLTLAAIATSSLWMLSGCDNTSTAKPTQTQAQPSTAASASAAAPSALKTADGTINFEAVESLAKGFTVNRAKPEATKSVVKLEKADFVVFYDMQCPHCGHLWEAAKKIDANIKWVPVGFLNRASFAQAATLLASTDPVSAMDDHEQKLPVSGGMAANPADFEKFKPVIDENTKMVAELLDETNKGVPFIVGPGQNGKIKGMSGALPPETFAKEFKAKLVP